MVVALGIVIAGAILAGAHKEEIKDKLAKTVTDTFANLTKENSEVANAIQELFQCCGAKDYKDWTKANLPIPVSCCVDSDNECNVKPQAFLFRKVKIFTVIVCDENLYSFNSYPCRTAIRVLRSGVNTSSVFRH